jgi:hypothetical protein
MGTFCNSRTVRAPTQSMATRSSFTVRSIFFTTASADSVAGPRNG